MKVLLVTGQMAKDIVTGYAMKAPVDTRTLALPISVASFLTPGFVAAQLRKHNVKDYDLILVPGAMKGDVSLVAATIGRPTFKGPTHASELPWVLGCLDQIELSTTASASSAIAESMRQRFEVDLSQARIVEQESGQADRFYIGSGRTKLAVGRGFPMKVLAEIVDAPKRSDNEIAVRAKYYADSGADVIDLGMVAGNPQADRVRKMIEAVRSSVDLPVSIDTFDPKEIEASASAGIDLVLSLDNGNVREVAPFVQDIPVVITPTDVSKGMMPSTPISRVRSLYRNIEKARQLGIEKIVADPILEPLIHPGLLPSLEAYQMWSQRHEHVPMLFGIGNVTELIDADSVGVNALLAMIGGELGASLLLAPETSDKATGTIRELAVAARMYSVASRRKTPPKDLGMDLLILKEKRINADICPLADTTVSGALPEVDGYEWVRDPSGWFRITINRTSGLIALSHFSGSSDDKPSAVLVASEARTLYVAAIERALLSRLDHAAYLGSELQKAETALRTGRSYVQDAELFKKTVSSRGRA